MLPYISLKRKIFIVSFHIVKRWFEEQKIRKVFMKIKQKILFAAIKIAKGVMSLIYAAMKLLPVKEGNILFISRQSNELTLDFKMLREEINHMDRGVNIMIICCRLDDSKKGVLRFVLETMRSMYYLATCRVCVLDAYWPAVSMLHHKKELTVIQMWHALGKIKQSGYQTLDRKSGRSEFMAEALSMHRNYDYVIAGGSAWNEYYCKSFDIDSDRILNIGLPRIDYLICSEEDNKRRIYEKYPEFVTKPVILYVPTFRRNGTGSAEKLISMLLDNNVYSVVVKSHPNQPLNFSDDNVFFCPEFSSMEMLSVSEYVITDYSAIAIEAAILDKKTLYYLYDYEEYVANNGLNVDPMESMRGCAFKDAESIVKIINEGSYNLDALEKYRKKYLPDELGTSTKKLAEYVLKFAGR